MASTSTKAAATKSILKPKMTFKGHGDVISYFPDGQRMISGSYDKTTRQWDLKAGKELEEARGFCEKEVWTVAVSRDSRWVVTGGGFDDIDEDTGELKACEVETGIVKEFEGHSRVITCIDISADSKLLASGSYDETARIWNLETGKLVAGPFKNVDYVGAVGFSTDSKKLAIKSWTGTCLEVWDIQEQKLGVSIGEKDEFGIEEWHNTDAPIFWTTKNKSILAAFTFDTDDAAKTIYEFDASTLEILGTPFKGHTSVVIGLAISSYNTLLASSSWDTIKLWAFESRQLLASFVQNSATLVLSPDSRQLAYTSYDGNDHEYDIYICDIPPDVLAQARTSARKKSTLNQARLGATRRPPTVRHRPPMPVIPMVQRPPPIINPQQPILLRLRELLPFSSRTAAIPPVRNHIELSGPLDFPATSPLPYHLSGPTATQGRSDISFSQNPRPLPTTRLSATPPTTFSTRLHNISTWWPVRAGHALPPIVDVPHAPGQLRNATAGAPGPDNEYIREEDYVPPSLNTGTHGRDRYCFCF